MDDAIFNIILAIGTIIGTIGIGKAIQDFISESHKPEIIRLLGRYENRVRKITSSVVVMGIVAAVIEIEIIYLFIQNPTGGTGILGYSVFWFCICTIIFIIYLIFSYTKKFREIIADEKLNKLVIVLLSIWMMALVISSGIIARGASDTWACFLFVAFGITATMISYYRYAMSYEISRNEHGKHFIANVEGRDLFVYYGISDSLALCGDVMDINAGKEYKVIKMENLGGIHPKDGDDGNKEMDIFEYKEVNDLEAFGRLKEDIEKEIQKSGRTQIELGLSQAIRDTRKEYEVCKIGKLPMFSVLISAGVSIILAIIVDFNIGDHVSLRNGVAYAITAEAIFWLLFFLFYILYVRESKKKVKKYEDKLYYLSMIEKILG